MGIRGLTSFVSKSNLGVKKAWQVQWPQVKNGDASKTLQFSSVVEASTDDLDASADQRPVEEPSLTPLGEKKIPLIIDGSALFYDTFFNSGDWVHSGQFIKFEAHLKAQIAVLKSLNFGPIHVLIDGCIPEQKVATCLVREADKVRRIVKTCRSVLAGDGQYRTYDGFMPNLAYYVGIETLKQLDCIVQICWQEADVVAAQLARDAGGIVLSKDSDFFIFKTPGYMPLYDLEIPKPLLNMFWGDSSIEEDAQFTVSAVIYDPTNVASHCGFASNLIPLLAALAGNDFADIVGKVDKVIQKEQNCVNVSPHERIHEVSEWIKKFGFDDNGDAVSIEKITENLTRLVVGDSEDLENRKLISKALADALSMYGSDAEYDSYARNQLVSKAQTANEKAVLAAFEAGSLPLQLMDTLLSGNIWCGVRLCLLDANDPCLQTRAIRLFATQQLSLYAPNVFNSRKSVNEYVRRGYNYVQETIGIQHQDIVAMYSDYSWLPDRCVIDASLNERQALFYKLTQVPSSVADTLTAENAALVSALRLLIHSTSTHRSGASPKLTGNEVDALIISSFYAASGQAIMRPPTKSKQGSQEISEDGMITTTKSAKQQSISTKTAFTPRGLTRASAYQVCIEHVVMLLQVLKLEHGSSKWSTDGTFKTDVLLKAYNGPLLHFLFERLKNGDALKCLNQAELDSSLFSQMKAVVTKGLEGSIDNGDAEIVQAKKSKKNKEKKTQVKSSNPFDLLGVE